MRKSFDDVIKENIKEHNSNWPQIPDDLQRMLIVKGSGCGKANSLFNLRIQQPGIDNIYVLKIHMKQNINF